MESPLIYIVTALGITLALLSFFIIIRGKPISNVDNTKQELEFMKFKIKTNGVVMLLVLSLIVSVFPLSIQAYLEYLDKTKSTDTTAASNHTNLEIFITGQVLQTDGEPVEGASVTVTHLNPVQQDTPKSYMTDNSGAFDFIIQKVSERDRYRIVAAKKGLVSQHMIVAPSSVDLRAVLLAERKEGEMP